MVEKCVDFLFYSDKYICFEFALTFQRHSEESKNSEKWMVGNISNSCFIFFSQPRWIRLSKVQTKPTSCMSEAPDLLPINISFVPDQPVDQTGPSRVPTLVQTPLYRCTNVHLGEPAERGDGG